MVEMVGEWASAGVPIRFAWVKAHVWVVGHEFADEMAKLGCVQGGAPVVTKGGLGPSGRGYVLRSVRLLSVV